MTAAPRPATAAATLVVLGAVVLYATTDAPLVAHATYLAVLVGASVGAWVGAERAPRGRRMLPRLIALGVSLSALGDTLWTALDVAGAATDVSVADPPWFASYTVLCVALWLALRHCGAVGTGFVIDAATIATVSLLLFWQVSIESIVADDGLSPLVRAVWSAYPVADAVLLALVVRIALTPAARRSVGGSLAVGVCLWLAADITYLYAPTDETVVVLMDAAWMIAPVWLARAAWRAHRVGDDASPAEPGGGRAAELAIAIGPLLVPAALELVADVRGDPDRPLQLLVGTAVLVALALVRTTRLLRVEQLAHRELAAARDLALDASRAKSMFLANVSHEIRTPLTTVLATAELLEDSELDDTQRMLLTKMQRSGGMLRSLVEQILDFSRIDAGELVLSSVDFDLHAVVAEAADVHRSRAVRAGLRFRTEVDPQVPREVVGDPGRLFQVLSNLLDNAVKFTHEGEVLLAVRPSGDDELEFVVVDTGIGIRAQDQRVVFDSFRQVDGSSTRRYGGSGLGLAICRELTVLMGGSLSLRSAPGAGSTFVARLPLPTARALSRPPRPALVAASTGASVGPHLSPHTG